MRNLVPVLLAIGMLGCAEEEQPTEQTTEANRDVNGVSNSGTSALGESNSKSDESSKPEERSNPSESSKPEEPSKPVESTKPDKSTNKPLTLEGHAALVLSASFSPDGTRLVSASGDKTVKVWDAATGQERISLEGHTGGVNSVAFSPKGMRLVSTSYDKTVKVWDCRPVP